MTDWLLKVHTSWIRAFPGFHKLPHGTAVPHPPTDSAKLLVPIEKALPCFPVYFWATLKKDEGEEKKNVVTEANLSANLATNETLIDH